MRQVVRRLRDGHLELAEVPDPVPSDHEVRVRVGCSVISAGTERATLDIAQKNLVAKARARPDQARQVIERARRDGVRATLALVRQRLDELGALGYSAAGTVEEIGRATSGLSVGQLVAIGGAGRANHAEIDVVPSLLCAAVPDGVSLEDAAFATLGAIAMNGFRRSDAAVGSKVCVIGLGLIGQLAVRIAIAAGCQVTGVDLSPRQLALAEQAGARGIERAGLTSGSREADSADAVLICAATPSSDPVEVAATLARDRAPVVVVGDVGMDVPRKPFYEKELDLRLSRSYGPGRYDPQYEVHGIDYPIGHVRWTEQRNMASFLDLVAAGRIHPSELVTNRYPIDRAEDAFEALRTTEDVFAITLDYGHGDGKSASLAPVAPARRRGARRAKAPSFGLVGPGSFATATVIPGLIGAGFTPAAVASASGLSAESACRQFDFEAAHASVEDVLEHGVDLLVVTTQHESHARLAIRGLEAGAAVYVEKPLALTSAELEEVAAVLASGGGPLFVGFNRRFAPLAQKIRSLPGPKVMTYRVNAGPIATDSWINDPRRGGGRLLGEGCHFVDFLCDQVNAAPVSVTARGFPSAPEMPAVAIDNYSIQISFADGSIGNVTYAADAPPTGGKERFETSAPGAFGVIDDFRSAVVWRGRKKEKLGERRQDKGFKLQYEHMHKVMCGKDAAPDPNTYVLSTSVTLTALRSLETGGTELLSRLE